MFCPHRKIFVGGLSWETTRGNSFSTDKRKSDQGYMYFVSGRGTEGSLWAVWRSWRLCDHGRPRNKETQVTINWCHIVHHQLLLFVVSTGDLDSWPLRTLVLCKPSWMHQNMYSTARRCVCVCVAFAVVHVTCWCGKCWVSTFTQVHACTFTCTVGGSQASYCEEWDTCKCDSPCE